MVLPTLKVTGDTPWSGTMQVACTAQHDMPQHNTA
jgi:hypothetical protein